MPAIEFTRYCVDCDNVRLLLQSEADVEKRATALLDKPRHVAKKTDINGRPLCLECFERTQWGRKSDYLAK